MRSMDGMTEQRLTTTKIILYSYGGIISFDSYNIIVQHYYSMSHNNPTIFNSSIRKTDKTTNLR